MMESLSIRQRLLVLAGGGVLLAALIGAQGLSGLHHAAADSERLERTAGAVRDLMYADMVHENTRAELMRAGMAAAHGDAALLAEVQRSLGADLDKLIQHLEQAAREAPDEASADAVRQVLPAARAYRDRGVAAIAAIVREPGTAPATVAAFDQTFRALEAAMDRGGDALEQAAERLSDDTHRTGARSRAVMLALFGGGLCGLLVLSTLVLRSVLRPLQALQQAVDGLNGGQADLAHRLPASTAEFGRLSAGFNGLLQRIAALVGGVQASAGQVASASQEIARGNEDMRRRSEQTAGELQRAVQHVEQIALSVRQSADAAVQADELARRAREVARQGGSAVQRVVATMVEIDEASRRIADIIATIDGIAFQTSILALNAAVEAARAGEQGRGFAVVATEVRTLAGRSAQAAREIKGLIGRSVERVQAGGGYVQEAGQTMAEIERRIQETAGTISAVTASVAQQGRGIDELRQTMVQLDRNGQGDVAMVEQTAAAAADLASQASELKVTVAGFRA